jgi:pseudouridine-5'-phosphate glycosidase
VPVVGYRTAEFPSFFARESGFGVDFSLDTPEEVGTLMDTKWKLGLNGGMIIANPVPESDALDHKEIEAVILQALSEAKENNIAGKKVTPFLLDKVKQLTGGKSLQTNIALVKHNAQVAAQIAVAYQQAVNKG